MGTSLSVDVAGASIPMKNIELPAGRVKKSFDVSQHPSPPPTSGRFASQQ